MKLLDSAMAAIRIHLSIPGITLLFFILGTTLFGQTVEIEGLQEQLEHLPENHQRVDLLVELADKVRFHNFRQAIRYTREAIKLAEALNYDDGRIEALRVTGFAQIQHKQERKGMETLISVVPYYESRNDPKVGSVYQALVNISKQTGDSALNEIYREKLLNRQFKQKTEEALERITNMRGRLDDKDIALEEEKAVVAELQRNLEIVISSRDSAESSWERAEAAQKNLEQELESQKVAHNNFKLIGGTVVLLLLIFGIRQRYRNKLARQEAASLKELNEVKSKLYTYVTHEFRTPLTIISGISDQIYEQPEKWYEKGTKIIKRNANNLLRLINHMLDLRKLESGALKPKFIRGDIIEFLKYLIESFHSLAESKDIHVHLLEDDPIIMDYDPEMVSKIISNLLSNAIKFTPQGGNVYLQTNIVSENGQEQLELRVKDTGIGIPEDQLPKVFERFYQVLDRQMREGEGTGIGLTLTKELIKLLNGRIEVTSKVGEGTTFTMYLPITKDAPVSEQKFEEPEAGLAKNISGTLDEIPVDGVPVPADASHVLVIEDNTDVIEYIKACLAPHYQIEVARDGEEGINKAIESVPDIVISDVMMPEKDGFEVCGTLKNDDRTSHIPIILLTAKVDFESKIEGLQRGADVYLAKPFNKEELLIRIGKLLEIRKKLQVRYQSLQTLTASDDPAIKKEDEFIISVKKLIAENISDENFGILQICRKLGVSRTQLHNKLKALTSLSTSIFIQTLRLQKAKELLETTDLNISQVAYEVGFKHPNYFSRLFSKEFGYPPSRSRN